MKDYQIIEYTSEFHEQAQLVLDELEDYIISIDEDHLDIRSEAYHEQMLDHDLQAAYEHEGTCFLAVCGKHVLGLIIGMKRQYTEADRFDYACPPAGVITELSVREDCRHQGIGTALIRKMESFFLEKGCSYMFTDIFAYNRNALSFYRREGFRPRMVTALKKLKQDGSAPEHPDDHFFDPQRLI